MPDVSEGLVPLHFSWDALEMDGFVLRHEKQDYFSQKSCWQKKDMSSKKAWRQKVNSVWWLAELATVLFLLLCCDGFYIRSKNTFGFAELFS